MNIAFIGLGNMGSGMALNLLKYCQQRDHKLSVLDLNSTVVEQFVQRGAVAADSAAALVQDADILFTSLPGPPEITLLADEILQNLPANAAWFETSTNELGVWNQLIAKAPPGLILVDAPVTGGAEGAAAGSLTMLLGVDQEVLEKYAEVLASFTGQTFRMGPSGAGYVAKLCQLHLNYLVAQGIGEALMLGAKGGLDLASLHRVLQSSCAQSYVVDSYVPKVLDGSYDPSFTLGLATRDMRLINKLGEQLEVPMPLADEVYDNYQAAKAAYGEDAPHLQIVKLLEDRAARNLRYQVLESE
ncbi:MAG: NAD(P)-dependent oxidoreductase [Gammaproteobacteria bacterium]|nr:NAD(P)-dependent oxidoreductase [Gammaproteobacteria bacterium]